MTRLFLVAILLLPATSFAYTFCRVDLRDATIERHASAVCDGRVVYSKGAGRNNLGYGVFTEAMAQVLEQDPNLRVLNCEGTDFSTCYLVRN